MSDLSELNFQFQKQLGIHSTWDKVHAKLFLTMDGRCARNIPFKYEYAVCSYFRAQGMYAASL
jgi:hypothetical protein